MCLHVKYTCVWYVTLCVCLWPATPVHLKLFGCRQARSARSRPLHLLYPPLSLSSLETQCVWMSAWKHARAWLLLPHAHMWIPTHKHKCLYNCRVMQSALVHTSYPLIPCTQTHTVTQTELNRYSKINQYSITLSSLISACVSWRDSRKASEVN